MDACWVPFIEHYNMYVYILLNGINTPHNAWNIICSLRDKAQVEQLLRYVVEEVPEDAENKRSFKYDIFVCCHFCVKVWNLAFSAFLFLVGFLLLLVRYLLVKSMSFWGPL
jgi:hypothetical protein